MYKSYVCTGLNWLHLKKFVKKISTNYSVFQLFLPKTFTDHKSDFIRAIVDFASSNIGQSTEVDGYFRLRKSVHLCSD